MKNKTSNVPTRIYKFGCRVGQAAAQLLRQEHLRAAHDFYNTLIGIELERRTAYRQARAEAVDLKPYENVLKELKEKIDGAREELNQARKRDRHRTKNPELANQIKAWREELKIARVTLKAAKEAAKDTPELLEANAKLKEVISQKRKEAYANAPTIFWGTKLLVAKSIEAAARSKIDPKPKYWRGIGRVGVQIQHTLTTEGVFCQGSQFLQLDPLPADQWDTRSGRRSAYTKARLRIGSDGTKPIWVEVDVLMHRRLPQAQIKWAWIHMAQHGLRTKYTLQLALESEEFREPQTGGVAALVLSWSSIPDGPDKGGIRVGYLLDPTGVQRDYVLDAKVVAQLRHPQVLRQASDVFFNRVRDEFKTWLNNSATIPDWMVEETKTISHWKGHKRLAAVAYRWSRELFTSERLEGLWASWKHDRGATQSLTKTKRQPGTAMDLFDDYSTVMAFARGHNLTGGAAMALYLEWWRRKNRHIYMMESNERQKGLLNRKEQFRKWAAEAAADYATILVENWDLSQMARNAQPEESGEHDFSHGLRTEVAPGEFRGCFHGLVKLPIDKHPCPACHKSTCYCEVPRDLRHCWTLLQRHHVKTPGVSSLWEDLQAQRQLRAS